MSGYIGRGQERNGPFNSYIYGNRVYVGKDIIPKIAVDKASKGVYVANNIFYFENDPVMVLGDQYKPDPGGGSEIENVFFENNIFRKNHWPKEVLIQPKNNILISENEISKVLFPGGFKGKEVLQESREKLSNSEILYNLNLHQKIINIDYLNGDSKGLWRGF